MKLNLITTHKQILFNVLVLIAVWISIPLILINKGLKYSDYNDSIIVSLNSDKTEDYTKLKSLSNYSKADEASKTVTFQKVKLEDLNTKLNENFPSTEPEAKIFEVTEELSSENLNKDLKNLLLATLFMTIATLMACFYIFLRNNKKISLEAITGIFGLSILVNLLSTFIYIGFLSLLSTIYQIRSFELNLLVMIPILTATIFALIFSKGADTFIEFIVILRFKLREYLKFFALGFFLIIVPVLFALGVKFVLTSVLLLLVLSLPAFIGIFISNLYNLYIDFKLGRLELSKEEEISQEKKKQNKKPKAIAGGKPTKPKSKKRNRS